MTLIRRCGLSLAVAFVLGCSSDSAVGPNGRFDHALAITACGAADGPALLIYLASNPIPTTNAPPGEYITVFIEGQASQLLGMTLPVSTSSSTGAAYHWSANRTEYATSGYVKLDSGAVGEGLDGSVDLQFAEAGHVHGEIHSDWLPMAGFCP